MPAQPTCTPHASPAIAPVGFASTSASELRESNQGQLVGDWVELFAPVVFEPHRPSAWPSEGSLLLDHLPFRIRAFDANGRQVPAGRVAFDVFCAVGYHAGKPRLWDTEAFASAHPANWSAFLGALPGEPKRVVGDAHRGMLQAVEQRWPEVELHSASGTCGTRSSACRSRRQGAIRRGTSGAAGPRRWSACRPHVLAALRPRGSGG